MPKRLQIAGLDCIEVPSKKPSADCVVMLHGYGANCEDLQPLHQFLDPQQNYRWLFPNAPLRLEGIPGGNGWAWYPIDAEALQIAMMTGNFRDFNAKTLDGWDTANEKFQHFLEHSGVEPGQCVLGGFSQGATLATNNFLTSSHNFKALTILSGTHVHEMNWEEHAKTKAGCKFIQSHGTHDQLLSFQVAKNLHKILSSAGLEGEFLGFEGGHEIPVEVLQKIKGFLGSLVG